MHSELSQPLAVYALPGSAVFPESVGVDPTTGSAYVGSLADGAIYEISSGGEVEVFSAAGADARASVAGVKVDASGRLWAAGGYEGTLHVYQLDDATLLARHDVGARPSCVNDIAFDRDGNGYITDSLIPELFRVARDSLELTHWVDLTEQGVPWTDGLNFNGIVLTPDERHLVVCQTNLGRLWQVALATGQVAEVSVDGGPLKDCDGLAISASTLYVAANAREEIVPVRLTDDGSSGTVIGRVRSEAFAFPTAVAVLDDRLLVVNGQLDKMGGTPELPFTVVAIARWGAAAPAASARVDR